MMRATRRHDCIELLNHSMWDSYVVKESVCRYFLKATKDLLTCLYAYKGVRLRDIKSSFAEYNGYHLDLGRLEISSWTTFLLHCRVYMDLQKDLIKEEVIGFVSPEGLIKMGLMEPPIERKLPPNHVQVTMENAYLDGFLDCADGIAMLDPRIPNQDLGSAAAAIKKAAEMEKLGKKSSTEQRKQIDKSVVTTETTAPINQSINESSLSSVAAFMMNFEKITGAESMDSGPATIISPIALFGDIYGPPPTQPVNPVVGIDPASTPSAGRGRGQRK